MRKNKNIKRFVTFKSTMNELMNEYKEFKAAIITLRKYIVKNKIKFETKNKFKELIIMWQKAKEKNMENFFDMKELHSHISGDIHRNHQNTALEKLWNDYLQKGCTFRVDLLAANHRIQESNGFHS